MQTALPAIMTSLPDRNVSARGAASDGSVVWNQRTPTLRGQQPVDPYNSHRLDLSDEKENRAPGARASFVQELLHL